MRFILRLSLLLLLLIPNAASGEEYQYQYENVMGTFAEFCIATNTEEDADETIHVILTEIDRLSNIFSTYDEKSEVRSWMKSGEELILSAELFQLLEVCEAYQKKSSGTFNPRVAIATSLWNSAQKVQRLPTAAELRSTVDSITQPAWSLNRETRTARFLGDSDTPLSFDAVAKGLIIDKVCERAMKRDNVHGVVINIGGDLRVAGSIRQGVSIASPQDETLIQYKLELRNKAVATSSGSYRFYEIEGERFSHIIDPRTAQPVRHSISVTVLANSAAAADVLATALSVMPCEQAVEWCDSCDDLECLIVDVDGRQHVSRNWPQQNQITPQAVSAPRDADAWPEGARLKVEFELNHPATTRYRRPYVTIWIEDEDDFPVRTMVLWLQEGRGARWHRDLKRWYKQDSLRKLVDGKALIGTISAATRPAGKYKTAWDGKDDQGKPVKQGTYTLFIEAAREHGTYQLIRQKIEIGSKSQKDRLKGNAEIKSASYEYTPQ